MSKQPKLDKKIRITVEVQEDKINKKSANEFIPPKYKNNRKKVLVINLNIRIILKPVLRV